MHMRIARWVFQPTRAKQTGRRASIPLVRRLVVTGCAAGALGLGFAVPARADDPASPIPPDAPTVPVVASAGLTAPSNMNISIRIGSPGDVGQVTQAIEAAATAAAAAAPPAAPVP